MARGFSSKGELECHNCTVHKLFGGRAGIAPADPMVAPPASAAKITSQIICVASMNRLLPFRPPQIRSVGNANTIVLTDVDLESPHRMGVELAGSPQRKRRRIPAMGISSQSEDLGDREEMNLRQELKRIRQVERDMRNELTKMKRREEELIQELNFGAACPVS
jgi:hypothetical protein